MTKNNTNLTVCLFLNSCFPSFLDNRTAHHGPSWLLVTSNSMATPFPWTFCLHCGSFLNIHALLSSLLSNHTRLNRDNDLKYFPIFSLFTFPSWTPAPIPSLWLHNKCFSVTIFSPPDFRFQIDLFFFSVLFPSSFNSVFEFLWNIEEQKNVVMCFC